MKAMIDRFFGVTASGSTVRTEIVAGATTWLTMAYIAFVNPVILAEAGMDRGAVFVATCLAAAGATLLMALWANYPLALAPGMGINAYFAYGVVKGLHYSWQVALGAVFLSGVLFLVLSLSPLRGWIVDAIPRSQKMAISAGIGLFLGIIALKDAGIVVASPGDAGHARRSRRAGRAARRGRVRGDGRARPAGRAGGADDRRCSPPPLPASRSGSRRFSGSSRRRRASAPTFLALDLGGALHLGLATVVFVFLFVDLFDNTGTLIGVAHRAGLLDAEGRLPRAGRVFATAALAAIGGAALGTSTVDQLYRERRRGKGGRPHRAGRRDGRGAVSADPVSGAAGAFGAGLRDRAGAAVCRLHDGARLRRTRLGGRDRICAGGRHRAGDAADLLDRDRHRARLYLPMSRSSCCPDASPRPVR